MRQCYYRYNRKTARPVCTEKDLDAYKLIDTPEAWHAAVLEYAPLEISTACMGMMPWHLTVPPSIAVDLILAPRYDYERRRRFVTEINRRTIASRLQSRKDLEGLDLPAQVTSPEDIQQLDVVARLVLGRALSNILRADLLRAWTTPKRTRRGCVDIGSYLMHHLRGWTATRTHHAFLYTPTPAVMVRTALLAFGYERYEPEFWGEYNAYEKAHDLTTTPDPE